MLRALNAPRFAQEIKRSRHAAADSAVMRVDRPILTATSSCKLMSSYALVRPTEFCVHKSGMMRAQARNGSLMMSFFLLCRRFIAVTGGFLGRKMRWEYRNNYLFRYSARLWSDRHLALVLEVLEHSANRVTFENLVGPFFVLSVQHFHYQLKTRYITIRVQVLMSPLREIFVR